MWSTTTLCSEAVAVAAQWSNTFAYANMTLFRTNGSKGVRRNKKIESVAKISMNDNRSLNSMQKRLGSYRGPLGLRRSKSKNLTLARRSQRERINSKALPQIQKCGRSTNEHTSFNCE